MRLMLAHESHRVATTIGMVASVEAKGNARRVGLLEKSLNLVLVLHVRLSVWMEDKGETEARFCEVRDFVRGIDEPFPGIHIQTAWTRGRPVKRSE